MLVGQSTWALLERERAVHAPGGDPEHGDGAAGPGDRDAAAALRELARRLAVVLVAAGGLLELRREYGVCAVLRLHRLDATLTR